MCDMLKGYFRFDCCHVNLNEWWDMYKPVEATKESETYLDTTSLYTIALNMRKKYKFTREAYIELGERIDTIIVY